MLWVFVVLMLPLGDSVAEADSLFVAELLGVAVLLAVLVRVELPVRVPVREPVLVAIGVPVELRVLVLVPDGVRVLESENKIKNRSRRESGSRLGSDAPYASLQADAGARDS